MKKATLTFAGLMLALILCSVVFAYKISGYVYFDTTKPSELAAARSPYGALPPLTAVTRMIRLA